MVHGLFFFAGNTEQSFRPDQRHSLNGLPLTSLCDSVFLINGSQAED